MESKYNDYCICSPESYALIAKKYNEQLSQRQDKEKKSSLEVSYVLSLLQNNLALLEQLPSTMQTQNAKLQKIYVKTFNLISVIKKQFNLSLAMLKQYCKQDNFKQKPYPSAIKRVSIKNLCQVLKIFIESNNTSSALMTLDVLNCWLEDF